jgi:predicted transcriptional regulator of viral defense system
MIPVYEQFKANRIVQWKEVAVYLNNATKAKAAMQWLVKSGKALAIKKGIYYFKRPQEWNMLEVEVNPLIIAGKVHPEGVIGYGSALKAYGVAYSESRQMQVAVNKSVTRTPKSFSFQNKEYLFYRSDLSFGMDSSVIDDVRVRHFSRERILLEGLKYPDRFLGMAEFLKSVENFPYVNTDKLLSMMEHYPQTTISMRLGWLLERNEKRWTVDNKVYKELLKHRPESRIMLIKGQPKGNVLNKRWSLMVPKTLLHLDEA